VIEKRADRRGLVDRRDQPNARIDCGPLDSWSTSEPDDGHQAQWVRLRSTFVKWPSPGRLGLACIA
jgi:hypothetical protein